MKYAAKKIGMLVITVLLVSFLTFTAFQLISGDPAETLLGTAATPERVQALREELGLDRPFLVRYGSWLLGFLTGDLGESYSYRQPVWELVAPKLASTAALTGISFVLITLLSLPLGVLSARVRSNVADGIRTAFNQLCMALPPFVLGVLLSWVFGILLHRFMPGDFPSLTADPAGALRYLFYAAVCIAVPRIAMTVRLLRSNIAGEMQKEYVLAAAARGASPTMILRRHVLKNVLLPTVTFLGQTMAEIIGAAIIVEQVFAIPGIGRFLVSSVANRDYPVVQTIVVLLAFWVVLTGTLAELINHAVDKRLG
ncbi:MAG: ABC transporter permease [Clostridia bacterium]|nr:ABC transporter permease [Clostridia bacterium]